MRQILFIFLLLPVFIFASVSADSDDITQIGNVDAVYFLENAFRQEVRTSADEILNVEINSIAVEPDRILVRFFVTGLSESWRDRITDDRRLYGSYLPIAEILADDGSFLTPSSASRFSFLEFNTQRIIGGLLEFRTNLQPQAFYLNFNQIPFDTQPLSEGFTKAVMLSPVSGSFSSSGARIGIANNGIEFTLAATAQSTANTMIQPAVRTVRSDESISKFGWITVSDTADAKRFALTRGNLYGFNLSDDTDYSHGHAYVFKALSEDTPLRISMDHAYVIRKFNPAQKAVIRFTDEQNVLINAEDFHMNVRNAQPYPDENRIRLTIDSGEIPVSDISIKFNHLIGVSQPSVSCGIDAESEIFACDIYFDDISFPADRLSLEIDAVEYYKEGPWTFLWNPVPVDINKNTENQIYPEAELTYVSRYPLEKEQPPEVQKVLDSIDRRNRIMTESPGWIHEAYELDYQFSDGFKHDLIPLDQYTHYLTHYITESWYHVGEDNQIYEVITVVRHPENHEIYSAQLQKPGSSLDLIHAFLNRTNQPSDFSYSCFEDFRNIAESSAVFLSGEACEADSYCLRFSQSLNGLKDNANSQQSLFRFDPSDHFIFQETIDYGRIGLHLIKTTISLEKSETLPKDLQEMLDAIE